MPTERTFVMVKPDGVHRNLIGTIIKRLEQKGFKLVALKFMVASRQRLEEHYAEHEGKPFFEGLVTRNSGPVIPMVWEGKNIVKTVRSMLGQTDPSESSPGTIRGDFGIVIERNIFHGSDSIESAEREIKLWFASEELIQWTPCQNSWINE